MQAFTNFQEVVIQGRQLGFRSSDDRGRLARAYLAQDRLQSALELVEQGCDDYSAACLYQEEG